MNEGGKTHYTIGMKIQYKTSIYIEYDCIVISLQ